MRSCILLALTILFATGVSHGQVTVDPHRAPLVHVKSPELSADPLDRDGVWAHVPKIQLGSINEGPRHLNAAVGRAIPVEGTDSDTSGIWSTDGTWRARYHVRDAAAVRLRLTIGKDLEGGSMLVADATGSTTCRVEFRNDGSAWTLFVPGDTILVEYQGRQRPVGKQAITIRSAGALFATANSGTRSRLTDCHVDAMCPNVPDFVRDSIARIIYQSNGLYFLCTGTLIGDTDDSSEIPYILTAAHSISSVEEADSLIAYWFYHTNECGGWPQSLFTLPQSQGASLLVTSVDPDSTAHPDVTLLQLYDPVVNGQGFAGWTTIPPDFGVNDLKCLHHPSGTFLRISIGRVAEATDARRRIIWDSGCSEGGSDGAALFDNEWRLIGHLIETVLDPEFNQPVGAWFGRFDASLSPLLLERFLITLSGTWVDFQYAGITEMGTPQQPYNTLGEGITAAGPLGIVILMNGTNGQPMTVDPGVNGPITITSYGSGATIGD